MFVLSVLRRAPAGPGSSGASAGQTGPEGGMDPQREPGQPEGHSAEPALQPDPDPAALHQTAAEPGQTHRYSPALGPTHLMVDKDLNVFQPFFFGW